MLKAESRKRFFMDCDENENNNSNNASFGGSPAASPFTSPMKAMDLYYQQKKSRSANMVDVCNNANKTRPPSHFQPIGEIDSDQMSEFLRMKRFAAAAAASSSSSSAPCTPQKLYTEEEVKRIVERAISIRETQLREEYDRVLNEKLQEQFQSFHAFQTDYLARNYSLKPDGVVPYIS